MPSLSLSGENASCLISYEKDDYSGDFQVSIQVKAEEFAGHSDGYVFLEGWQQFVNGLLQLEKTRKGSTSFTSMSPNEFEITIKSIDSRGHTAVMGILGYQRGSGFQQQLSFAFEFDPSQLVELLNTIKANNV